MLIDWFTVAAQVLNFLILVWLMKRFLYQPVLDAIDAREQRIARELADAAAKQAAAGQERDAFVQRNADFDHQRAALLEQATHEVASERRRLLDAAQAAADALLASREQKLRSEAASLNQAIRQQTRQEVFAITRKTLAELASASLEAGATTEFIRRLHRLEPAQKSRLDEALASATEPVLVRSAFELPTAQRAAIQQAVREVFASERPLQFDTSDKLVGGIELSVNGQRVAWSIDAYLGSLEDDVSALLHENKSAPATGIPAA
ncbi:MAG: F0F1 ATP synthase subunit B [Rhodanobacter sp.]|nr:MAG: F0F1 ATP synthase subunit B [Rhodanobacter sp.]TAL89044.1 MAG: F0F1 ATP synthase subunit B [Rhodanobacter sp.]TAM38672.1 MAG: F0F1 ATP synthase subunit B [Rhodanobacter sp.]TAN23697.1 MAG: F0F1 ATP synthase subunit B [Rhodanobacter sp.]